MFIEVLLCLLSISGYYFTNKNTNIAYIIFIVQNIIAFIITIKYYMLGNLIFCLLFLYFNYKNKIND